LDASFKQSFGRLQLKSRNMASKAPKTDTPAAPPASYEAALAELEDLVAKLEGAQLPLDALLSGYQRGAVLLKYCRAQLEAVDQQVKLLDGNEIKPWTQE
jgi:exodeoxyribonuclease VII small subunit